MGQVGNIMRDLSFDVAAYQARLEGSRLAAQQIEPTALRNEAALMSSSHPEYRFLMPHEKTELFSQEYQRLYSRWYKTAVNVVDHEKMTGLLRSSTRALAKKSKREMLDRQQYSALWTRRQLADATGMTYNAFLDYAFESHLNVQRRKFPRPNQILAGEGAWIVLEYMEAKWRDWNSNKPPISYMPQYRTQFFCGLPAQDAHRESVIQGLDSRSAIRLAVANDLVSDEDVVKRHNQSALDSVREDIEFDPSRYRKPFKQLDRADLLPGCFRFPFAYDKDGEVCKKCPFAKLCSQHSDRYFANRVEKGLGLNDRQDRERAQARDRQRRRRERGLSGQVTAEGN